jgi:hypothetical protein
MAIATGTLLLAGAGIGSALLGARGAKKAANAQVASTEQATAEQRRQFDLTRADFAPWQQAGASAIGSLSDMLKPGYDHTTSPGYQFRFNEGQRAVESGAAAAGGLFRGGTLKDLVRFGQGVASDDFNQQFNRTASVAQGGQQANTTLGQLGANAATNIGNNFMQAGNARASGYAGQTAAFQNGLGNLAFLGMQAGGGGGFAPFKAGQWGNGSMPTSGWGNPGLY